MKEILSYNKFKELILDFHPQKIGYTYAFKYSGWVDNDERPIHMFTIADNKISLVNMSDDVPFVTATISANDPMGIRDMLIDVGIINSLDFFTEMDADPDIPYKINKI